jgi:hypothetical protein
MACENYLHSMVSIAHPNVPLSKKFILTVWSWGECVIQPGRSGHKRELLIVILGVKARPK